MKTLLHIFLASTCIGLFIGVSACGDGGSDGCSKDTDCAAGRVCNAGVCEDEDDGSSGGSGTGGLTTTGGGDACTPGNGSDSACIDCFTCTQESRCAAELSACDNSSSCNAFKNCVSACDSACADAADFSACSNDCEYSDTNPDSCKNRYPSGNQIFGDLANCSVCQYATVCTGCVDIDPSQYCN